MVTVQVKANTMKETFRSAMGKLTVVVYNGILLTAHVDAAFDAAGRPLLSELLSHAVRLGKPEGNSVAELEPAGNQAPVDVVDGFHTLSVSQTEGNAPRRTDEKGN
jgi:hypothetical protein